MNSKNSPTISTALLADIRQVIAKAQTHIRQTVNHAMVHSYWQVGRLIVEQEQQGAQRAEYGKAQLSQLSGKLTTEFGKGFDVTNLRNMRRFYLAFPIRDALRLELSWTHYRALLRVENEQARLWYMQEAEQQAWSARALDRQIGTLYYERLLASKDKAMVQQEAEQNTQPLADSAKAYLRDPYILDFLNLEANQYLESDLTDQKQLFASKYKLHLPSEEELKQELQKERQRVQQQLAQQALNHE